MANDVGQIQLTISVDDRGTVAAIDRTKKLEVSIKKLASARASQAITEKQYKKGLLEINRQMRTSNMSYQKAGPIIKKYARAQLNAAKTTNTLSTSTAILNRNVGNTRNRMNGANMAIQQMGYQFGDFAVQVQGGTSAFVAFSQQGSQLVGILPSIAGSLGLTLTQAVALSSVLGVMIPIGSAVGRMFMEMSGKSKSAKDKVEELIEALNGLESLSFNSSLSGVQAIEDKWSNTLKLVREYYSTIAEGNKTALFESAGLLVKDMESLAGQIKAINYEKKYQGTLDESSASLLEELNDRYDYLKRTKEILVGLDTSSNKNLADSFRVVVDTLTAEGRLTKELTTQLSLFAEQANISSVINKEKQNAQDKQVDALQHFYKFQAEEEAKALESKKRVAKIVKDLKDKEYADMKNRGGGRGIASPSKTDVALMGMGGVKADVQELAKAQKLLDKINKDLDRSAQIQSKKTRLSEIELRYGKESTTYKYTQKELSDLEFQIAQDILKEKLTAQGVDQNAIILAMALNAQEHELLERRKKLSQISYGLMEGSDAAQRLGNYGGRGTTSDRDPTMGGVSIYDDPKKTQAQEDADALAEYIAQLNHEKMVETELVGIFGSEREIKQKILDVQKEYDGIITPSQVKQIENTLKLTDAETKRHEALEKAKQEQEALGASIEASMEKAFMSMVDGTASVKDAFKSMASEIIKELYRVLVVKKAVAAISGALGFADGGVISSGSQVQAYADGGVVGSPTTFAMSGGKTGLMGEAGPEAIMPLKRGANGKLGVQMEGGGATTVVQNFNFSANGDDSVKRIIAQAAPKIAQMTKSEIINDRKRGGSMKAAFG